MSVLGTHIWLVFGSPKLSPAETKWLGNTARCRLPGFFPRSSQLPSSPDTLVWLWRGRCRYWPRAGREPWHTSSRLRAAALPAAPQRLLGGSRGRGGGTSPAVLPPVPAERWGRGRGSGSARGFSWAVRRAPLYGMRKRTVLPPHTHPRTPNPRWAKGCEGTRLFSEEMAQVKSGELNEIKGIKPEGDFVCKLWPSIIPDSNCCQQIRIYSCFISKLADTSNNPWSVNSIYLFQEKAPILFKEGSNLLCTASLKCYM